MDSSLTDPREWSLRTVLVAVAAVLAVAEAAWVVYYSADPVVPQRQHAIVILGAALAVYYFGYAREQLEDAGTVQRLDAGFAVLLGVVAFLTNAYAYVNYFRWLEEGRALIYTDLDLVVGAALIYVAVDATYRKYGRSLGLVILAFIAYGLVGSQMPGILQHAGLSVEEMIYRNTITLTGIFGFLIQVGATWIAIFIIFAGMVEGYGGFEYILDLGRRIRSISRSGVAQTAVITSMVMGTMMGSSASNVATTGSFTIPLMQNEGLSDRFAAATESVASTGGQIMPPIMGTAAFLMADILGIQYANVAIAAVIPTMLFYLATALGVHYKMAKNGWFTEPEGTLDVFDLDWGFVVRGLQYMLPVAALIYLLMVKGFGPSAAGLYTVLTLVLARGAVKLSQGEVGPFVEETLRGLYTGGVNLAPFMAILASLGIAINVLSLTGLAQKIAVNMVMLSGGVFVVVILIAMVVSLLFGMGMPTPAAYILVAIILAPGLIELGIPSLSAHMFVFYFALLSALTPPVALAVAIGISISGSDFVETVVEALRLGSSAFVIPFVWLVNPSILFWEFPRTLVVTAVLAVSVLGLVSAVIGYNGWRVLTRPERVLNGSLFLLIAFVPGVVGGTTALAVQVLGAVVLLVANWVVLPRVVPEPGA